MYAALKVALVNIPARLSSCSVKVKMPQLPSFWVNIQTNEFQAFLLFLLL